MDGGIGMLKFIDANIIIKAFTDNDDMERCRRLIYSDFVTNTLCLVEAHNSIAKIKKNEKAAAIAIKSLFKSNGIIVDLDKNLLFEAIKRIEKYQLDIFDLINYTTALMHNCTEIVSYDKDFNGLEIKRTEP